MGGKKKRRILAVWKGEDEFSGRKKKKNGIRQKGRRAQEVGRKKTPKYLLLKWERGGAGPAERVNRGGKFHIIFFKKGEERRKYQGEGKALWCRATKGKRRRRKKKPYALQ